MFRNDVHYKSEDVSNSVVDPDQLNPDPDPAFQANPDKDPGF
jgi:hypothetical protein